VATKPDIDEIERKINDYEREWGNDWTLVEAVRELIAYIRALTRE
jgi:hypothetical protein